jgi:hypothetical protein
MTINLNEQTAPGTPPVGTTALYFGTDGNLYFKTPTGEVVQVGGGGGSEDGVILSDITFSGTTANGDLVAHDGTNYLRATTTTLPVGMRTGTDELTLFGTVSGLTGLTAGQPYFQNGYEITLDPTSAVKIGFAISTTELLLDIDVEGVKDSTTPIGVFGGGTSIGSDYINTIDYIDISTTGNATDFGDLTQARYKVAACSSSTRGVFGGGDMGPVANIIDYITIATTGNATDFGDLTQARRFFTACSNSTRGVFGGGVTVNTIDYITIATTGNALSFGQLAEQLSELASCSSSIRGVFGGGQHSGVAKNRMDYITIATTSDTTSFGTLTTTRRTLTGCSNSTRGVFGGGWTVNIIDYITIATIGNATDFGDLTQARRCLSACSSPIRGVFGGGFISSATNVIDYITIATTGNATDFGDLTQARYEIAACSNAHGGL